MTTPARTRKLLRTPLPRLLPPASRRHHSEVDPKDGRQDCRQPARLPRRPQQRLPSARRAAPPQQGTWPRIPIPIPRAPQSTPSKMMMMMTMMIVITTVWLALLPPLLQHLVVTARRDVRVSLATTAVKGIRMETERRHCFAQAKGLYRPLAAASHLSPHLSRPTRTRSQSQEVTVCRRPASAASTRPVAWPHSSRQLSSSRQSPQMHLCTRIRSPTISTTPPPPPPCST
mmetsp:Transcript_48195/g.103217  ORF Transcript_48195/g.103217 Transcript_48195/m.103217 type:complete len:230 (-) Transcript_48195:759-1448(-)